MYAYFELITIIDFLEFLAVCKFTAFTLLNFLVKMENVQTLRCNKSFLSKRLNASWTIRTPDPVGFCALILV